MAKNRNRQRDANPEGQGGAAAPLPVKRGSGPPFWLRLVLSLAVAWHVFVVFISPMAIDPSSLLVKDIAYSSYVRWYSDSLYLNHGYDFFGPDPPAYSQLVYYKVTDANGATIADGNFPNTELQWPRLYYHRHMMLADQASNGPPDMPLEDWLRLTLRAYGRRLLRRHGGDRVEIDYKAHEFLAPDQVLNKVDPNDPRFFQTIISIDETAAGLEQPLPVPAPAPLEEVRRIPLESLLPPEEALP